MSFFCSPDRSPLPRAGGFRDAWCAGALGGTLLAMLLLAWLVWQPSAEQSLDTAGWTGAQFLEHLQRRGVQLRVVRGASPGGPFNHVYLTEDPDITWDALQRKPKVAERIDE